MGGGAQADFDSLIDLITTTVTPQTWDEVGGPGSIPPFPTNLSLVISQTQDVHEEIADLLEQLRRLQDLQVTIEVRFITLNDNFFERIGVDFQFNITNEVAATIRAPRADQQEGNRRFADSRPAVAPFPNFTAEPGHSLPPEQLQPGHAAVRPAGGRGALRLRHPERHRSVSSWSTPPRATAAATCCKRPRSRCSTASRRPSPTPRRRRS